jgi:hypothetical protein
MNIHAIILTRWVLAILNGDEQAQRMYEAMDIGEPEF